MRAVEPGEEGQNSKEMSISSFIPFKKRKYGGWRRRKPAKITKVEIAAHPIQNGVQQQDDNH
jgi:hypothetical protein